MASCKQPAASCRHDKSGVYVCIVQPVSREVEDKLSELGVKYTRKSPTEIRFTCSYNHLAEVNTIARHLTWVRQ